MLDFISQVATGYWPTIIARPISFIEPRVIAHEIGHQFGLADVPITANTLMSPWDGGDRDLNSTELSQVRNSNTLSAH
jgi:hypothetical protein